MHGRVVIFGSMLWLSGVGQFNGVLYPDDPYCHGNEI